MGLVSACQVCPDITRHTRPTYFPALLLYFPALSYFIFVFKLLSSVLDLAESLNPILLSSYIYIKICLFRLVRSLFLFPASSLVSQRLPKCTATTQGSSPCSPTANWKKNTRRKSQTFAAALATMLFCLAPCLSRVIDKRNHIISRRTTKSTPPIELHRNKIATARWPPSEDGL